MKRFHLEIDFSIDYAPYVCWAEGDDIEELLADAQYSVNCPDPETFHHIDNLPENAYDMVVAEIEDEVRSREEMRAEAMQ